MLPIELKMTNFCSHSESEVDFTKFNSCLILGVIDNDPDISNGAGKSSIFDAIRYALFNAVDCKSKNGIVRRGTEQCFVSFIFEIEHEQYKVERRLSLKKGSSVNFYKKINDEWVWEGYTADTATVTNKNILNVLKINDSTFINSVYFTQEDLFGFASAKITERKEILREILDIGVWDKFQDKAKTVVKSLKEEIIGYKNRIKGLGEVEKEKLSLQTSIKELEAFISQEEKNHFHFKNLILELEAELDPNKELELNLLTSKLKEVEEKVIALKSKELAIKSMAKKLGEDYQNAHHQLIIISDQIKKNNAILNNIAFSDEDNLNAQHREDEIPLLNDECNDLVVQRDVLLTQKENLLALKVGEECPTCLSGIKDVEFVNKNREKRKNELEAKISVLNEQIKFCAEKSELLNQAIKIGKRALLENQKLDIEKTNLTNLKKNAVSRKNDYKVEISSIRAKIKELTEEKKTLNLKLKSLNKETAKDVKKLKKEITTKKNALEKIDQKIFDSNVELANLTGQLKDVNRREVELTTLTEKVDELVKRNEVFAQLSDAFGKNGVQSIIMENITDQLEQSTNSLLNKIYHGNMSVSFQTQKQVSTGKWREDFEILITKNHDNTDFSELSGGEKLRVAFALRLALSQLLMRRMGGKINLLLLDEVDQPFDKIGLNSFVEVIEELSQDTKILIITHNDYLKEKFDNIIYVYQTDEVSTIKQ